MKKMIIFGSVAMLSLVTLSASFKWTYMVKDKEVGTYARVVNPASRVVSEEIKLLTNDASGGTIILKSQLIEEMKGVCEYSGKEYTFTNILESVFEYPSDYILNHRYSTWNYCPSNIDESLLDGAAYRTPITITTDKSTGKRLIRAATPEEINRAWGSERLYEEPMPTAVPDIPPTLCEEKKCKDDDCSTTL